MPRSAAGQAVEFEQRKAQGQRLQPAALRSAGPEGGKSRAGRGRVQQGAAWSALFGLLVLRGRGPGRFEPQTPLLKRTRARNMALLGEATKLAASILKVQAEIEKVEAEIVKAGNELSRVDLSDTATLQFLRKEVKQLRNEEIQLRNATPLAHPKERMRQLLRESCVDVDEDVLSLCTQNSWLAVRLSCVSTTEDALRLYADAEAIPQSQTRAMAAEQGVAIAEQVQFAGAQRSSFFRAFVNTKHLHVLKVNNEASKSLSECRLYAALGSDAVECGVCLVPVRLLSLDKSSERQSSRMRPSRKMSPFVGLLMPCYAYSFNELPAPIPCNFALEVFRRIIAAIDFIHDRGWLHGDVKPGNIFCDCNGDAWLGDYGSSVPHEALRAFTGGTPKYQCADVSHLGRARLFDGVGLVLSLLDRLGAPALRGGGGTLRLDEMLAAVRGLSDPDVDELYAAIFEWVDNLRTV